MSSSSFTPRLNKLEVPLRGPRLVDVVLSLIQAHGMTNREVAERYGVGQTWLAEQGTNPGRSPACDTIQTMYEDLTGKPLLQRSPAA